MAVTSYHTLNGEIIGETTGGVRTDYLTDALGSVVATVNQSAQVINTYRYKPFGSQLAKTGVGSDPTFRWVGIWGYRQTGRAYSDEYVRLRSYSALAGRWTTVDPLGYEVGLNVYSYARQSPTVLVDPLGLHCNTPTVNIPLPSIPIPGGRCGLTVGGCGSCWRCSSCPNLRQWCFEGFLGIACSIYNPLDFRKFLTDTLKLKSLVNSVFDALFRPNAKSLFGIDWPPRVLGTCNEGCQSPGLHLTGGCIDACLVIFSGSCCYCGEGLDCSASVGWCGAPALGGSLHFMFCLAPA